MVAVQLTALARLPLAANLAIFAVASALVWLAGGRLVRHVREIAVRTRADASFVGTLVLGSIVSLPELATSVTAAALGDAELAASTLLGGVAITMVILAVIDAIAEPEPLSASVERPQVMFEGVLTVVFLLVAAAGITAGEVRLPGGVGAWTTSLFVLYLLFLLLVKRYADSQPWRPTTRAGAPRSEDADEPPMPDVATRALVVRTLLAAVAILAAGVLLAVSGDALAEQTGLGTSFVGMVLGGVATSLPELSTALEAAKEKQYELAFGDAFGTNLFSVMTLFFVDLAYRGKPVLEELGDFALFAVLLGATLTSIFLAGVVGRPERAVLRMGVDSIFVLLVYAGGLFVLYALR